MTITRVGSNSKYASGWETAFGKAKPAKSTGSTRSKATAAKKIDGGSATKNLTNTKAVAKKATPKKAASKKAAVAKVAAKKPAKRAKK